MFSLNLNCNWTVYLTVYMGISLSLIKINYITQSLAHRSKTRTNVADTCRKYIRGTPIQVFAVFIYFSYLSFLHFRQRPEKRALSSCSSPISVNSTVNGFVHAICKRLKKCLMQKVVHSLWSLILPELLSVVSML